MPNYCDYSMCVKGTKENVEEFIKVIQADYDYNNMKFNYKRHLFRVFEAHCDELEQLDEDVYQALISGYCAWSVSSCMLEHGYYRDIKARHPKEFRGTTLKKESKRLNLAIEVYSEECGCEFQEHYIFIDGQTKASECVDYHEYYIGEFNSKAEAEEELDIEITDEEWNSGEEYIQRGGFESWDFEI